MDYNELHKSKILNNKLCYDNITEIITYLPEPLNDITIREAIKLWFSEKEYCIQKYGHISEILLMLLI